MNKEKYNFETIVGFAILLIVLLFVVVVKKEVKVEKGGYNLHAKFEKVDGISTGSDVKIAGIKVGSVIKQSLDYDNYEASLVLNFTDKVKVPDDSIAKIVSDGFFGGKYISIEPGGSDDLLKNEQSLIYTQSSVNLEELIGKFIFSQGD